MVQIHAIQDSHEMFSDFMIGEEGGDQSTNDDS